jgi:hypothetical protein
MNLLKHSFQTAQSISLYNAVDGRKGEGDGLAGVRLDAVDPLILRHTVDENSQ